MSERDALYHLGLQLLKRFFDLNRPSYPDQPIVIPIGADSLNNIHRRAYLTVGACAWYRNNQIWIKVDKCANIGRAGRCWSYPGYTVDRTPYGVLAHEVGHWAEDQIQGIATRTRQATREEPISGYCPNDSEWWAEMFRLFLTNPDLLRKIRPATYVRIARHFLKALDEDYETVLSSAPVRTLQAARKKINYA